MIDKLKIHPDGYIFKFYPLLVAIFIALRIEAIMFVNKQITIFHIITTVSSITLTINFLIIAVVTNCYGKQSARQLIWINNIIAIQFALYNFSANSLQWASISRDLGIINSYQIIIPLFVKGSLFGILGENVADFLFTFLYSRYKNNMLTKSIKTSYLQDYFVLFRYSFIANFVMLSVAYSGIFFNRSIEEIITLICGALLVKTIIELFLSPIAVYAIVKLKKLENFDVYDLSGNNPFAFLIKYEYLNFYQFDNGSRNSEEKKP
jgi:uncharacterized PurR-regulated membrane protein YhhQ (DUF165 family)